MGSRKMNEWYKEDLAFIHDVGFSDWALKSAPGILEILNFSEIREGLIVELGCGSGLSAQEFRKAHYKVLGIDISESMIEIARTRVPDAEFRVESLFKADIPSCNAVISLSECLNYLFDSDNNSQTLVEFFYRIYNAMNYPPLLRPWAGFYIPPSKSRFLTLRASQLLHTSSFFAGG